MRRVVLVLAAMALALLLASGVAWAVNKIATNGPDTLRGTNGADNLSGRGGKDILNGLGGSDNLLGGTGNDAVIGGLGSDNILGAEGNDFLVNGPGLNPREVSNNLSAGGGNDVVFAANRPAERDVVTCGGGFDRVFADRKDVVADDCERVADRPSEFEALFESIPQSFFEGLP